MKKGQFIVLEGLDATGKSLIAEKLAEKLSDREVMLTREPGGANNKIGEEIRKILLNNDTKIDALEEAYLFATSRACHSRIIEKALQEGKTVICDRYIYSSIYYQGEFKGLGVNSVFSINHFAIRNAEPDIIVYLSVSAKEKKKRLEEREILDRLDNEFLALDHDIATDQFKNIISRFKHKKCKLICIDTTNADADKAVNEILKEIYNK